MTNNQLNPSFGIHLIKICKTVLTSFEENIATSCLKRHYWIITWKESLDSLNLRHHEDTRFVFFLLQTSLQAKHKVACHCKCCEAKACILKQKAKSWQLKNSKVDKHRKMTNNQLNPSFGIHLIKISKTVLTNFEENLATSCLKSKITQLLFEL
ncbi:unnamed protein product [Clavelina lepadiformis]|uniref:Uncharacterized protein n=1 Tax=Clavelina lepadiformis TaxID=159417 RepID=A0ABP0GTE9_CLALP